MSRMFIDFKINFLGCYLSFKLPLFVSSEVRLAKTNLFRNQTTWFLRNQFLTSWHDLDETILVPYYISLIS